MFPTVIKLGPFAVRSYGLMVAIGLFAALQYLLVKSRQKGLSENKITDMVLYTIVAGLIGARIAYVLTNFRFYFNNPSDIFKIWEGGLVFYGGFLAGLLALAVFVRMNPKLDFWELGDILAPAVSLGHAFGRVGCLLAGCCYGKPSELPWAVKFTNPESLAPLGVCLHPTQIYESLGAVAIFAALDRFNTKPHKKGQTVFAYLFLYGLLRFLVEFLRGDDRGAQLLSLSQGQMISLIIIAASAWLFFKKNETNN